MRRTLRRTVVLTCGAFCLPVLLFPLLGPPMLSLWSGLPVGSFPGWIIWPVTLLYFSLLLLGPFYIALSAAGSVAILAASHFLAAAAAFGAAAIWHDSPKAIPAFIACAFAISSLIPAIVQTSRILLPRRVR